jgi:ribosome biogenesis GTPase
LAVPPADKCVCRKPKLADGTCPSARRWLFVQDANMNLSHLGFSPFFEQQQHTTSGGLLARITRTSAHSCQLRAEHGVIEATIPRALLCDNELAPVVGDWVVVEQDGSCWLVRHVFERRTRIARRAPGRRTRMQVIAANVDLVFVVTGLDGDFNPRRIERYLTLVADSGASAVVLLTKAGICPDVEAKSAAARAVAPGTPVLAVDVLAGIRTEALADYVTAGHTIALVGSSGAGKSTLVNHLLQAPVVKIGSVRDGDDRGRHTTTHRELFWLPQGGALIDNPGMRELQLWVDSESLDQAFVDVTGASRDCRFSDCSHAHEPGCAVRDAVARGDVDDERLDSYLKLRAEVDSTNRRRSDDNRRADERQLAKRIRQAKHTKGRRS